MICGICGDKVTAQSARYLDRPYQGKYGPGTLKRIACPKCEKGMNETKGQMTVMEVHRDALVS